MSAPMVPVAPRAPRSTSFSRATSVLNYGNMEYFRQPLYDRVNLATSLTGDISTFTVQNGGAATLIRYQTAASVSKTYRDTNLPTQGQDPNKDYAIYGISVALVPIVHTPSGTASLNIRSDKDMIKEGGSVLIKVSGNKEILRAPMLVLPELNAESGAATTITGASIFSGPQMAGSRFYPLTTRRGEPWMLGRGTILQVIFTFDGTITLSQSYDMLVIFDADVRRPV